MSGQDEGVGGVAWRGGGYRCLREAPCSVQIWKRSAIRQTKNKLFFSLVDMSAQSGLVQ